MKYISNHTIDWCERTKEDLKIHDIYGRAAVMKRLWLELEKSSDDVRALFEDEHSFRDMIVAFLDDSSDRDLSSYVQEFTDEILFVQ